MQFFTLGVVTQEGYQQSKINAAKVHRTTYQYTNIALFQTNSTHVFVGRLENYSKDTLCYMKNREDSDARDTIDGVYTRTDFSLKSQNEKIMVVIYREFSAQIQAMILSENLLEKSYKCW